ncbi:TM2 domain-containing protein [Agrococcus jejuensis]|uniref:TM2 domain-containing protein n=1 Tax=Agrococcus jejuensis TaxID=399736 RepID=UPI0021B55D67|nr:TM2 domain-containing protein [Agrococcus jejuensis]
MTTSAATPAGWRRDAHGIERWWDGQAWGAPRQAATEITLHAPSAPLMQPPQQFVPQQPYAYAPPQVVIVAPLKEAGIAYVLAIFLGTLGIHRFYLGRVGTAIAILSLTVLGGLTAWLLIGLPLLLAAGIWWVIDLFLIPGMVREENQRRLALQHGAPRY